jgi:hypothetical protein
MEKIEVLKETEWEVVGWTHVTEDTTLVNNKAISLWASQNVGSSLTSVVFALHGCQCVATHKKEQENKAHKKQMQKTIQRLLVALVEDYSHRTFEVSMKQRVLSL